MRQKEFKILYLTTLSSADLKGVSNKIISKINSLNKHPRVTAKLLTFINDEDFKKLEETVNIVNIKLKFLTGICSLRNNDRMIFSATDRFIIENKDFSTIIFRYPFATRSLYRLLKKYPKQIIFEHNTKEVEELKLFFKNFGLRDFLYCVRKLSFENVLLNLWRLLSELYYGKKCLALSRGLIGVTNEILVYEIKRSGNLAYGTVISNGISVKEFPLHQKPIFKDELNLVLLSGHANVWSGADRIIWSLDNYKGGVRVNLFLVGSFLPEIRRLASKRPFVKMITSLSGNDLTALLNSCHIGVGPLAIFRKELNEACALKTREYLARGMPVLLSYFETDVSDNPDFNPYLFKVPNNDSLIDINELIGWYRELSKQDFSPTIQALAYNSFDVYKQAQKLLSFLEEYNAT